MPSEDPSGSAAERLRARLWALEAGGSLPASACPAAVRNALQPALAAGLVREERAGAGRSLRVIDAPGFAAFLRHLFPDAPTAPDTLARVAAVARFRDSKGLPSDTPSILLARAWSDRVLTVAGEAVAAGTATRQHGVFAWVLRDDYQLRGPVALVENPAVFQSFELLPDRPPVELVLYAGGRAPQRVLEWLARPDHGGHPVHHCPDYDPVGLSEFLRLRSAVGARARLHRPANLANLLARHGNRDLLRRKHSQALLARLRGTTDPEVAPVLALIDQLAVGLEQEALLLASPGPAHATAGSPPAGIAQP